MRINSIKRLKVIANAENLKKIRDFTVKYGTKMGLVPRQISHLKLCIDEACSNINRHAYSGINIKKPYLVIEMVNAKEYVEIRVIDWGKDFKMDFDKDSLNLNKYVEDQKKGGLGLFMIKKFMDYVEHKRVQNSNILVMRLNVLRPESYWILFKKNLSWEKMSLRVRFAFLSSIAISLIIISLFLIVSYFHKQSLISQYLYNSERTVKKMAANSIPYILDNQDLELTLLIKELKQKEKAIVSAGVVNSKNYIIAHTDAKNLYKKYETPVLTGIKTNNGISKGKIIKDKDSFLYLTSIVSVNNIMIGRIFIITSNDYVRKEVLLFDDKIKLILFSSSFWLLGILGIYFLGTIFVQPIKQLADEIRRVSKEGITGRLMFQGKGEFAELAMAFNKMMGELKVAEGELTDTTRLKKEMQLAQDIQHTLLPKEVPQLEGYDIGAKYEAAMEVGGDYYDFFNTAKFTLGIAVGDVSGKGIGGALVMTMTRTALRLEARNEKNAAVVLSNLNATLDGEFKKGMYITLYYVVLDAKKRVINYSSAGHNPMILYRGDTGRLYNLNPKGFAVGLNLGTPEAFQKAIKNESIKLMKGDLLFIYTDGITEAMNPKREEFGEYRLLELIKKYHHLPAQNMADKVLEEIKIFAAEYPQSDDITFVILKEKSNVTEVEYNKRLKLFELIEEEKYSIKNATKSLGISMAKYHFYKDIKDKNGIEALKEDIDEGKREIDRMDIEGSRKMLNIAASHPEFSVNDLLKVLDTEEYGFYKSDSLLISRELTRLNLTTIEKRERFAKREKILIEKGKKSVFLRSGYMSEKDKTRPEEGNKIKTSETTQGEIKQEVTKVEDLKPEEPKQEEIKDEETKTEVFKPDEPKQEEIALKNNKPDEIISEEIISEEIKPKKRKKKEIKQKEDTLKKIMSEDIQIEEIKLDDLNLDDSKLKTGKKGKKVKKSDNPADNKPTDNGNK